jgi:hypothetical protein
MDVTPFGTIQEVGPTPVIILSPGLATVDCCVPVSGGGVVGGKGGCGGVPVKGGWEIGGAITRVCGTVDKISTSGGVISNSNGLSVIFSKIICIGL